MIVLTAVILLKNRSADPARMFVNRRLDGQATVLPDRSEGASHRGRSRGGGSPGEDARGGRRRWESVRGGRRRAGGRRRQRLRAY